MVKALTYSESDTVAVNMIANYAIITVDVLIDTCALQGSYISLELAEKIPSVAGDCSLETYNGVYLDVVISI